MTVPALLAGLCVALAVVLLPGRGGRRLAAVLTPADEDRSLPATPSQGVDEATIIDLVGIGVHAGLPPERALDLVAQATGRDGLGALARSLELRAGTENTAASPREARSGAASDPLTAELARTLEFSASSGAPVAPLLHGMASDIRARTKREAQRRAAKLGVQLVLPLGLCILPAFVLLGIVPVVLSLLSEILAVL
ncbi:type II secretion system F family protein [Sediminivirga luteola]|uniref:type II secretion system F family protein n=1 Tax=Sediminivirga luteola TaxID=1774748 RepID=UPI001F5632DE|nr:type II secretion system F family protein [Sediminivirga luteola]MCI2266126.1 type II secretion system F family protein [Sediminivirga luteola]